MIEQDGVVKPARHADKIRILLMTLIALFPVLSIAVKSGGSIIYTLLFLISLFYAWPQWKALSRFEKNWLLSLVVFFALGAVSLFFSENIDEGWKRLERYFRLMSIGSIFLLLLRFQVRAGTIFIWALMVSAAVLAGQAFYETLVLEKSRAEGIYYAIGFGDMSVLVATILVAALMTIAKDTRFRLLVLSAIVLALYATIESVARGAWLFIPFAVVLFMGLYWKQLSNHLRWIVSGSIVMATLILLLTQPATITNGIQKGLNELQRYQENPEQYSSWGVRLNLWRVSLNIFRENPMLGTGLGDFHTDNKQMVAEGKIKGERIEHYGHAHSIYFEALATTGLLGLLTMLIALLVFPFVLFYHAWQLALEDWARFYALAGMVTVTSFAVFGLTEGWLSRNPFVNPYVVYVALFAAMVKGRGACTRLGG